VLRACGISRPLLSTNLIHHAIHSLQAVLTICKVDPVVRNAESLLRASRKYLGDRITFAAVRNTFFKQFW